MIVPDRVLDVGRFRPGANWLIVGALLFPRGPARYVAVPEAWSLLDRAGALGAAQGDGACTKLSTAA